MIGSRFVDVFARDSGVKSLVKFLQRFERLELFHLGSAFQSFLLPQVDLVLEDQLQKFHVAEPVGGGLLQGEVQRASWAGAFELFSALS